MQKNRILLSLGLLAALSVGLIWFGLSQEVSPDSNAAPVSQAYGVYNFAVPDS